MSAAMSAAMNAKTIITPDSPIMIIVIIGRVVVELTSVDDEGKRHVSEWRSTETNSVAVRRELAVAVRAWTLDPVEDDFSDFLCSEVRVAGTVLVYHRGNLHAASVFSDGGKPVEVWAR